MFQGYLWEDNKKVAEWLQDQLDNWATSTLRENLKFVQKDYAIQSIKRYGSIQTTPHKVSRGMETFRSKDYAIQSTKRYGYAPDPKQGAERVSAV